nr:NLR protein Lr13 [Triticum aestivum]
MAMILPAIPVAVEVISSVNALNEFVGWATPHMKAAIRYARNIPRSPDEENTAAQRQIQEKIEQLGDKLGRLKTRIWKLKTTMPKMLDLIDRVEWQSHKEQATVLLPEIKDAVYDAEDLLDEFDYYALKLKVECNKNLGQDHLHNAFMEFLNTIDSDEPNNYTTKVNDIQERLDHLNQQSKDMGLHKAELRFDKSVRPETSSFVNETKIFGRKKELKSLMEKLGVKIPVKSTGKRKLAEGSARMEELPVLPIGNARMTELSVLPIVGMGGMGKTTMAQQICNDSKVKKHFNLIIWTCASDDFDKKRLTKEILEHLGQDTSSNNLNFLMTKLQDCVRSKKFLLVVDDMWDDILKDDGAGWREFCAPLQNGSEGSRILVTTRFSEVAKVISPTYHYELPCLKGDIFWEFFKLCAFGSTSSGNNRESLECIGKNILPKLKGNPLAAKTIGRLLRMDLSTTHWENIMESELWQVEQMENDILPALRLSYMYLPQNLKRCFSICAMYPKDHKFEMGFLADIWTAHGYAENSQKASLYFNALANRSFFQQASSHSYMYVIHDLMHDTAQLVTKDECFIIKHPRDIDRVPSTVRHLSIFGNGDIECSELKKICNSKKIRTLVCDDKYNSGEDFASVIDCWFKELLKIRVLKFRVGKVKKLPESMGNSKHLRYFCLLGPSNFGTLPSSVCRLHKLRIIERGGGVIKRFPPDFSDLISLQRINSKGFTYDRDQSEKLCLKWPIIEVGAPSSETVGMKENQMEVLPHWNIQHLHVENYKGESCPSWLMPQLLPGLRSLKFRSCDKIKSIPFFVPSEESRDNAQGPDNLNRLEELVVYACYEINWQGSIVLPTSLRKLTLSASGCSMDNLVSCFRDLTSLTHMEIRFGRSLTSIPLDVWSSSNLPSLEDLSITDCYRLASISASGASSSSGVKGFSALAKIEFYECGALLSLDEFLTPDYLPAVKTISVTNCEALTSVSVDRLHGLENLEIGRCHHWRILSVPSSLKQLDLYSSDGIEFIDLSNSQSRSSSALKVLSITGCPSLRSIGGEAAIAEIMNVGITGCPNLTEIQQPLERGTGRWWPRAD